MKTNVFLFMAACGLAGCGPFVGESATTAASGGGASGRGDAVANSPACRMIARDNAQHWSTLNDQREESLAKAEAHFKDALEVMAGKKALMPTPPPGMVLPAGVEMPGINMPLAPAAPSSKLVRDARAKGLKLTITRGVFGLGFALRSASAAQPSAKSAAMEKQLAKSGLPPEVVRSLRNAEAMRRSGSGDPAVVALASHVNEVGLAYGEIHQAAQHTQMTAISVGAGAQLTFRACHMEPGPEDVAQLRRMAGIVRRANIAAAGVTATLATYQGVVDGADPKALDTMATGMLKALAEAPAPATDDEVHAMVDQWKTVDRAHFERSIQLVWGESYPLRMKVFVDNMFQSLDQVAAANAQLEGRAPPALVVTPAPAMSPVAPIAQAPVGSMGPTGKSSTPTTAALDAAQGIVSTLPQGTIRSSVEGMVALGRGDVKGVFGAALNLVPGGTLARDGLSLTMRALGIGS